MFTIGFVSYKSWIYIKTQLQIYKYFAGEPFKIIIVDTSRNDKEFGRVKSIVKEFNDISIDLISYDPPSKYSSGAHGEGLQRIYNMVQTPYFLTQDPDFFWVKPQFLTFLKSKLETHVVVGAPYTSERATTGSKYPWFPSAWGAAYRVENLRVIEADFRWGGCLLESVIDVGWQIRERLGYLPYYTFQQKSFKSLGPTYEDDSSSREFLDEGLTVAYHLGKGNHETYATKGIRMSQGNVRMQERLRKLPVPKKWQDNRTKACEFFWKKINDAANGRERS